MRLLPVFLGLAASSLGGAVHADWRRLSDIELNTAYTLDEGSLSVGLFSPLSVGVTETFQASIHPLLLLLGQPSLALRQRLTAVDDVTTSINLAATWSFIKRETIDGRAAPSAEGATLGYPGTMQLTSTTSVVLGERWLLTGGGGVAADFLGADPIRTLVELHASVHWLPVRRHLVMLQLMGFLSTRSEVTLIRPSAQVLYAWSLSAKLQLALGMGMGEWQWESDTGTRRDLRFFPMLDLWFRF
jgi:hypothetical protein